MRGRASALGSKVFFEDEDESQAGILFKLDDSPSMNRMTLSSERLSLTPALSHWERGNYRPTI